MRDEKYKSYLQDESRLTGYADDITFPTDAAQVESAIRRAAGLGLTLTVQGARTGIVGAAVPNSDAILNMSDMKSINGLSVDDGGVFYVTLEPGVTLADLNDAIARKSFNTDGWSDESLDALEKLKQSKEQFFPPNPTEASATIGGIFASNAQGPTAFYYGDTARYIQSVSVILANGKNWEIERGKYIFDENGITLPDGEVFKVNTSCLDPVCHCLIPQTGMDLLDLFAGSEGVLGVVTSLTLRLKKAPVNHWGLMFFFDELSWALAFSQAIKENVCGIIEAVELFDKASLNIINHMRGLVTALDAIPDLPPSSQAAVYVQIATENDDETENTEEALSSILDLFVECGGKEDDTWAAEGYEEMRKFRLFRHAVPEGCNSRIDEIRASYQIRNKMATDFSVPPDRLGEAADMYRLGMKDRKIEGVIFGHAAVGRLHVNLFPKTDEQFEEGWALIDEWADKIISMGGKLADENGVGKIRREFLARHIPKDQMDIMKTVKNFFDPKGILNPGNMI
ncbi:FAD-linked oxidase [Synergistales bacterium]|nr:FAD-linked oxidase [Synergistales bacterium]